MGEPFINVTPNAHNYTPFQKAQTNLKPGLGFTMIYSHTLMFQLCMQWQSHTNLMLPRDIIVFIINYIIIMVIMIFK